MSFYLKSFFLAVQFLTRLPTPQYKKIDQKTIGFSSFFYPFIGLVIGVITISIVCIFSFLPVYILSALLLLVQILINGALHLDGLADSADAWLSQKNKQKSLVIMKDPHLGTAGVVSIVLLLLIKFVLISEVIQQHELMVLLLTPVIARVTPLFIMLYLPYAKESGIALKIKNNLPKKMIITIIVLVFFVCLLLYPSGLLVACVGLFFLIKLMKNRLQGFTGDTLGATIEIIEVLFLFGIIFSIYTALLCLSN